MQMPCEMARMNASHQAGGMVCILIDRDLKVSTVDKIHAPAFTHMLCRFRIRQCSKRIMLMAGSTADRTD